MRSSWKTYLVLVSVTALILAVQINSAKYFYDSDAYFAAQQLRERESFKRKLSYGISQDIPWPGLKSTQVSWAWLELLQALHVETSYDGDFSWIFSKLYFVSKNSNEEERNFLLTLAPFYFVMGNDGAGSTLFLDELLKRSPQSYNVNFWAGFHALENLGHRKMASHFYGKASLAPGAPPYLAALSARLQFGDLSKMSFEERVKVLEANSDPQTLERIKTTRPEWFSPPES